ncbi:M61 family peptidase [Algoriphagus sediminis]|uniref:M61 family peptidase n=1 Tax=Algoriphagus sediminis TaxID=3057113 RepID=A0ABT7YG14_9BACT|nr:M61 family peptidase [Algoriphagus sediminis]MDN3205478.1 M61 family peptidase [Algoriphagus sediminis]
MIKYKITVSEPSTQFLKVNLTISNPFDQKLGLQFPAWRAGRYQLADYAKNVRSFAVRQSGEKVYLEKLAKNSWQFNMKADKEYEVSYEYFAGKMDAGSCYIDEEQIYINFVNCCVEVLGVSFGEIQVEIDQKLFKSKVCTLTKLRHNLFQAQSFQELADSTFLAARELTHWTYKVASVDFNVWIKGKIHFDKKTFLKNFCAFTDRLINDFGEFPEKEYHFILQLLPYKHYHGVEHRKGTVITYGPASELEKSENMEDLLGVSCHELYHAWNVCRIRPKELILYDFGREVYTDAGWILEGITTYMGDLYLLKSGVYELPTYLKHLSKVFQRESMIQGYQHQSILNSSLDLWLDGYQTGIPYRKTSIYTHGALIAFSLDLLLLSQGKRLSSVMTQAWEKFGKPNSGYSQNSFWRLLKRNSDISDELDDFYREYIDSTGDIIKYLEGLVPSIGLEIVKTRQEDPIRSELGIITSESKVTQIHPMSIAKRDIIIGDKISAEDFAKTLRVQVERINGNTYQFNYPKKDRNLFPLLSIELAEKNDLFLKWSK